MVLGSSALGLPVSTSHILIGCVVGVGLAERLMGAAHHIDGTVLVKIMIGWAVTIPLAMAAAVIVFYIGQHEYQHWPRMDMYGMVDNSTESANITTSRLAL